MKNLIELIEAAKEAEGALKTLLDRSHGFEQSQLRAIVDRLQKARALVEGTIRRSIALDFDDGPN
jgi:hypothetical protein